MGEKVVVALLLGRAGSVGFPGKNTSPVLGRPLMRYPMLAAENSKYVTRRFFSTDSEEYKKIGKENGWEIIDRPPHLATKEAKGEDAFLHAFHEIKRLLAPIEVEFIAQLHANSATLLASHIDQGVELLRTRPDADSAVTVSVYNMWSPLRARRLNNAGFLDPFVSFETFGDPKTLNCDRDSQGSVYFADMALSLVRPSCLENIADGLLPQKWMGKKILPIPNEGGLDVDYNYQMPQTEFWLKKNGFTEYSTPYDKQ
jgi:CMP-N-acetylneuraminic acid synthetase